MTTILSLLHKNYLDLPFTSPEVLLAIQDLKSNKPPERAAYWTNVIKKFKHLLLELTTICNNLTLEDKIPKSWTEAHIIVIPTKDKDPARVESYRPISLLNNDAIFLPPLWLNA